MVEGVEDFRPELESQLLIGAEGCVFEGGKVPIVDALSFKCRIDTRFIAECIGRGFAEAGRIDPTSIAG